MVTCDEARSELGRARERVEHERDVLSRYREQMSDLEDEHRDLTRRWEEASGLVVENEREWDRARERLRSAIETLHEKQEKLAYWNEQKRRLDNGESTDYSGEGNERAIINGQREDAYNAEYDAESWKTNAQRTVDQVC